MRITEKEVIYIVKESGLEVVEDTFVSITNGQDSMVIPIAACSKKPPYSTLYNKEQVLSIIKSLS